MWHVSVLWGLHQTKVIALKLRARGNGKRGHAGGKVGGMKASEKEQSGREGMKEES